MGLLWSARWVSQHYIWLVDKADDVIYQHLKAGHNVHLAAPAMASGATCVMGCWNKLTV